MKAIAKVWTFKSSSSAKTYQTLLYSDSSTSCDCPGWTRRVDTQGNRSCKHTRMIDLDLDLADAEAVAYHGYNASETVSIKPEKHTQLPLYGRKLCI